MSEFTIDPLGIPSEVGGAGWSEFVALCQLRNAIQAGFVGTNELSVTPEEMLPHWLDPQTQTTGWLAWAGDTLVGRGMYVHHPDDDIASVIVQVLPEYRNRGLGSALYERVEESARTTGKTVFQTNFLSMPDEPGPRISPAVEAGSVATEAPGSRFALKRGYVLQLILRYSRMALPVDPAKLAAYRREAEAASRDYRVVRWEGRTPERWLDAMALMRSRMETDAPHGDLDMGNQVWDAQRVRDLDDIDERSGRRMLVAAAEHTLTGELVAYTELGLPQVDDRPVEQRDTIVLAEHRGHRLGMLLKVDNVETLESSYPGRPSITTINAEGNTYMLAVNDAVGFVPMAQSSAWKLEVSG